ncbi:MAG TPA: alpha/beta hydrolase [Gammaproteobacteria bacterium]|nr:alpha/beta hydrolase [Gammaproteobacteria bacterium]
MKPDEFLVVDGVSLEARRVGPPPDEAPTLVMLHEGLGCAWMWKDFPQRLSRATGWGVLAYSRAGYGASDPVPLPRPLTYMHTEGLQILPRLLDAAGIRQAVLLGHSDGASIALINAGGVPDPRVIGGILMAPHVFNEDLTVSSIEAAREAYRNSNLRERLARYHGDNVDTAFWGWNEAWLDPGFRAWNIEEYLPDIAIPLVLIQGRQDPYGTAAQIEAIERQAGGEVRTVWLDDCGHSPQRDRPEATLEAVDSFLPDLDTLRGRRRVGEG